MSLAAALKIPLEISCTDCKNSVVVRDERGGQHVCTNCGLVLGKRIISEESEWRTFADSNDDVDMNRVGGPSNPLLGEEASLFTQIGKNGEKSSLLNKYQNSVAVDSAQKQLQYIFSEIENYVDRINLSKSVKEIAQELYKQLYDEKELRGRSRTCVVVTCIYIACKLDDVPRSLRELCNEFSIKRREVGRCFIKISKLTKSGKIKLTKRRNQQHELTDPRSSKFLLRFCSQLKLPASITNAATHTCKEISRFGICGGKSPASIAAASILLITYLSKDISMRRTPEAVAKVAHITEGTVKSTYIQLYKNARRIVSLEYATDSDIGDLKPEM